MEFRILGPLEVHAPKGAVPVPGSKLRATLAVLVLHANEAVSAERVAVALWGEDAPAGAVKTVQVYVSRLRRALGDPDVLSTTPAGYRLRIRPGELDAERFGQLAEEGRRALSAGEPERAAAVLGDALSMWRGPPLAEFAFASFAQAAIARLDEQRLAAIEMHVEAGLALGRHSELVAELQALIARHPLSERLRGQLMLALYRCGRQADALEAYRAARGALVEEIGVEPGPELRRLHEAILSHDPALELDPDAAPLPKELDAATLTPLVGRSAAEAWLEELWQTTRRSGVGAAVAVIGPRGMGKTRLAAELARSVHPDEGGVLYVAAHDSTPVAHAVIARALEARQPTLLVVDDLDRADGEVRATLAELLLARPPVLVLATAEDADPLEAFRFQASRVLEPLDVDGAREIAQLYAGEAVESVSATRVLEASRGVPRRIHELVAEWTRLEAAQRVDAAAGRAAASRSELRGVQTELAGNVVDLQLVRERADLISGVGDGGAEPVACPFKGLAAFGFDDAEYFCGRERMVAELVARMVGAPLLGLVGASGSGKSSLLRAGLLPALAAGVLPGSRDWARVLIRPGGHPITALRDATAGLADSEPVVVAVDQFEELFTACRDEGERRAFVDELIRLTEHDERSAVVVAIRADFYSRCAAHRDLSDLLAANHVLVGPMRRDELRRAIERPTERAGLRIEPELVDALLADVEVEPGGLPLLASALLELWQRRDGRWMRLVTYERIGGVRGAVARLAEDAFGRLDPAQQAAARAVFLRLAGEDAEGAIVRRRVPLADLERGGGPAVPDAIALLTERRLLTLAADTVEVAHEALLREWPRLRGWLDEDAEGRRVYRRLTATAREWSDGGRVTGDLYRGATLASALEWRARHEDELSPVEAEFLDAGRVASGRAHRRLIGLLAGVAALLVIALIGGVVALQQRGSARAEARASEALRLGIEATGEGDLARALLLARQGVALDDTAATRGNLFSALLRAPAAVGVFGEIVGPIDLAPGGDVIAMGDGHGRVHFFDTRTRRPVGRPYRTNAPISTLRFSPDGSRLAVEGLSDAGASVDLVDVRTRRSIAAPLAGGPQQDNGDLLFSPDSELLLADFPVSPRSSRVLRWSARTGRPAGAAQTIAGTASDPLVGFLDEDGTRLLMQSEPDKLMTVVDASTLKPLQRIRVGGVGAVVTADGRVAAIGGQDGTVRFVDLSTGRTRPGEGRHDGPARALSFTHDGRRLVTAGDDGRVIVWDVRRAAPVETFDGRSGRIPHVVVSPDDRRAYTASEEGGLIAWDLAGDRHFGRPFDAGEPGPVTTRVPVSSDGSRFAVQDSQGYVNVYDSGTLEPVRRIRVGRPEPVDIASLNIAMSPDRRTLAVAGRDGLAFWDLTDGHRVGPDPDADRRPYSPTFGDHGRWLAARLGKHQVGVWDARTHELVERRVVKNIVQSVSASTNTGFVAASIVNPSKAVGAVEIFSLPDLEPIKRLTVPAGVVAGFSPDGKLLAVGDVGGVTRLFDTRTWQRHGRELAGHTGALILTASFSPDGGSLATSDSNGTARLWDVASQRPIGAPLEGIANNPLGAAFVRAGTHLLAVSITGRGFLWDLRPEVWMRDACTIAGRVLTRSEWADVLPQREYEPACR